MVSESATWVGTLPYECDYDRPPFVIHRQLFAVEVPMSEWHRFRHVFSAVSRLLLAWTRVRNCKATWTVSTVSFDPGYVCMPAGLLRRVEAEYVCIGGAWFWGTDYTLVGQIPESCDPSGCHARFLIHVHHHTSTRKLA